jgi:hypothetical protein
MTKKSGRKFINKCCRYPRRIISFYRRDYSNGQFSSNYMSILPEFIERDGTLNYHQVKDGARACTIYFILLSQINYATLHEGW